MIDMNSKVVTDIELRSHWYTHREEKISVPFNCVLTPAAKDFIRENNITLEYSGAEDYGDFTVIPIPNENGKPVFTDAVTGEKLYAKKENYTHLRGNLLVSKEHPQIVLRGKIDSLMAEIIETQVISHERGCEGLVKDLEEVLIFTKRILAAEVKDSPFGEIKLLGMNSEQLRRNSQNIKEYLGTDHPVPSYTHGDVCAALNKLRTMARETELAAVKAFSGDYRIDIIEALNRLSSGIYILYCRKISGYYGGL